jgi:hypothetical protein
VKLKFDSSLEYQLEAIKSVTDLFEVWCGSSGSRVRPSKLNDKATKKL